ncbi:MAG TPA: sulfite exporter TauE/SafE family protein [Stellaceae bacterium]
MALQKVRDSEPGIRSLTVPELLLLVLAGFAGGILNAIAGGGSFLTFAAMVFTGIPSIVANATSAVALFPGSLASAWTYRHDLPVVPGIRRLTLILISFAGSAVGAALLLLTPQRQFDAIVPWLLLGATLVFAFGPRVTPFLQRFLRFGPVTLMSVQFVIAIYGGYFGGAMGILMLASFSLFGMSNFHSMNALKTLLAGLLNGLAVAIFIVAGKIAWGPGGLMMAAGIAGGWAGAWGAKKIDPATLRYIVIALAAAITVAFFIK